MFRYNPRNHCWPEVWKSVKAISAYTLLLSVIETFIMYEINKASCFSGGIFLIICALLGLFNSIILRKYVVVISRHNYKNPRFACHCFILLFSCVFIIVGTKIEHNARAKVYLSKTLCDISFNEDEYYYIDRAETLDTINGVQDFIYEEQHFRKTHQHHFEGYYIAPFCDRKSVFYAVKFEREYPTNRYSSIESKQIFIREFKDSINRIGSIASNHLYQRITPPNRDYHEFYKRIINCSFSKKDSYEGIKEILIPMKNDRMPRWFLLYVFLIGSYILALIFCFSTAITEKPFR